MVDHTTLTVIGSFVMILGLGLAMVSGRVARSHAECLRSGRQKPRGPEGISVRCPRERASRALVGARVGRGNQSSTLLVGRACSLDLPGRGDGRRSGRSPAGRIGECGREEAVGPLLGEPTGVGKDDLNLGVADLQAGPGCRRASPPARAPRRTAPGSVPPRRRPPGGSSARRCIWKARVPSDRVAARLSRLLRSTAATSPPPSARTA
jgi:hypothetical protein